MGSEVRATQSMGPKVQPGRHIGASWRRQRAARDLQIVLPLRRERRIPLADTSDRESRGDISGCNNQGRWRSSVLLNDCEIDSACSEYKASIATESETLSSTAHVRVPMTTRHFVSPQPKYSFAITAVIAVDGTANAHHGPDELPINNVPVAIVLPVL